MERRDDRGGGGKRNLWIIASTHLNRNDRSSWYREAREERDIEAVKLPPREFAMGEFNLDDDEGGADSENSVGDGHTGPGSVLVEDRGGGSEIVSVDGGEDVDNALLVCEAQTLRRRMAASCARRTAESDIRGGSFYSLK